MNLNPYEFQEKVKSCGSFTVFKPQGQGQWYDGRCLVKAICPNPKDVQMISDVARRLTNLQIALEPPDNRQITYAVKCHPVSLKGVKRRVIEVFTIVNRPPQTAIDYIEKNCADVVIPGLDTSFNTEKLSVGPCGYRAEGKTYVKVRFDGVSIPFYFTKEGWDRESTHRALIEQNGPALATDFCEILAENQETILERALERPLNLSGISESAMHKLTYWIESPAGVFQQVKEGSPLLSVPNNNIVPVAEYGYAYREHKLYDYVLIGEELHRITGYRELKYNRRSYRNSEKEYKIEDYSDDLFEDKLVSYAYGDHMIFKLCDLEKLDPEDNFVREKVIRTLKAKL